MKPSSIIENILHERAGRLLAPKVISDILGQPFILAGGAMRPSQPRDYDIFGFERPINLPEVEWQCWKRADITGVIRTHNAITMEYKGQTIQLCKHFKPTALALVKSFDFSHIQAGVIFNGEGEIVQGINTRAFEDVELYHTIPRYMGSEYPLSSLARLVKFKKHGDFFPGGDDNFIAQIIAIFCDIIKRGFRDKDDFYDQCAAISAILPDCDPALLFRLLHKKGDGK